MQVGSYNTEPTVQAVDEELRGASDTLVERYAAKFDTTQIASKKWEVLPEEQRFAMRAANELVRRQNEAKRLQAKQADEQRIRDREDAAAMAEVEQFKRQAAGAFPGTAAEFESAWPGIKAAWQQQTTLERLSDGLERKRISYGGSF